MDFLPGLQTYLECEQELNRVMAINITAIVFGFTLFIGLIF